MLLFLELVDVVKNIIYDQFSVFSFDRANIKVEEQLPIPSGYFFKLLS